MTDLIYIDRLDRGKCSQRAVSLRLRND